MFSKFIEELGKIGYVPVESTDGKFIVTINSGFGCYEQLIAAFKAIVNRRMRNQIVITSNTEHTTVTYGYTELKRNGDVLFKIDGFLSSIIITFAEGQKLQMYGPGAITIFSLINAFTSLRNDGTIFQLIIRSI